VVKVTAAERAANAVWSPMRQLWKECVWLKGGWESKGNSASLATANWPAITVVVIVEVLRGERAPALSCALAHGDVCLLLVIILHDILTIQLQESCTCKWASHMHTEAGSCHGLME
jgi:hypothetical protein